MAMQGATSPVAAQMVPKDSRTRVPMVALYGRIAIQRTECPECGDISLVLDARTACCGVNPNINPQVYKQMSEPPARRLTILLDIA